MKILVACEESQAVTIEMRRLGHEAYSCDIEPCSGGHPEWHLQVDALELLKMKWDMILAFPPCTQVREKIVISLSMLLSKSVNHLVIHAENFRNAVTSYELQDIGKTVFLTREAAEAALKEREAEHDR